MCENELELGKILTPSRTPTPVKMVFAGENGWYLDVGEQPYGINEVTH